MYSLEPDQNESVLLKRVFVVSLATTRMLRTI